MTFFEVPRLVVDESLNIYPSEYDIFVFTRCVLATSYIFSFYFREPVCCLFTGFQEYLCAGVVWLCFKSLLLPGLRYSYHTGSNGSIGNIRNIRSCFNPEPVAANSSNLILPSRRELTRLSRSMKFETENSDSMHRSDSLRHWFKNWEELRQNKLTASTFASAIGFWPCRRTQLWLEKIGYLKPFSGNEATMWNNVMEKKALERYEIITENKVLFPDFQVYRKFSVEDSWLAASPDGVVDEVVYGLPSGGVLEIKCPYYGGVKEKHEVWTRIPLYFIPQVQGLMEILDSDWMDFYVWSLKGSSLFRVFRSREYWDLMKIALSDFWWNHVQPAKEIYSRQVIKDPLYELRAFRPGRRHALCRDIVCKSKNIVDDSELLFHESKDVVGRGERKRKQWKP